LRIAELDQYIEELVAEKARFVEEKRLPKEKADQEEARMKAEYEEGKNCNFVIVHDVPQDP
jgi:hypothetical protein